MYSMKIFCAIIRLSKFVFCNFFLQKEIDKIAARKMLVKLATGLISPTFYMQFLLLQIPKGHKRLIA